MDGVTYYRTRKILEGRIGDELVALDSEGGRCFGLNAVATRVWELLEASPTFEQLETELRREYEVDVAQCREDLAEVLRVMADLGLVSTSRP